jgi:osmotically-inducible protein OsmY
MAVTQYKCTNFAECDKALGREVIEIEDGEEAICPEPECGAKLEPIKKQSVGGRSKLLLPAVALLCLIGLVVWLLIPNKPKATVKPIVASTGGSSVPQSASVPTADTCSDRQVAMTIKDRLAHDEDLKGDAIQVDVANRTVILSGTVDNDMARNYAADLVARTGCPMASVVNDLKIGPLDPVIVKEIRQLYAKDSSLRSQAIKVEASHGNVVLSGFVTESIARTVAADLASHAPGVATVTNNLQVRPLQTQSSSQDRQDHISPIAPATGVPQTNLSGLWTGTFQTCAQGQSAIRIQITDAAPDDITASVEIMMPNSVPGTFVAHGVLNTMNSFLVLQFGGWQHQPPGLTMGNIGGYVTYTNQIADSFSGVIKSPGCGQIILKKQ